MIHIIRTQLFILIFFVFSSCACAAIYKWVDENGQTHFGSQPPAQSDNKKLKEKTGNTIKAERNTSPSNSRSNDSSQQRSAQSDKKDTYVDCYAAVDNTKASFKALREVGREKYRSGELSYEKYRKGVDNLRKASGSASLSDCNKSTGEKRKFYQCMYKGSGDAGNAVLCALLLKFK
ncbi:MAG: DUF4124 domain-containing protein [Gammaproteobacteria bacterium]|jgi:hypothetical protein